MPPPRTWLFKSLQLLGALVFTWALEGQVQSYRHFDDRDGLPQSQVTTLLEDREGFLWAGTTEGVARLGASGFQTFGTGQGLQALDVDVLYQDRAGAIWVGAEDGGADRIVGDRITHFGEAQGLTIATVYCLLEDASGNLLAGTRQGLFRARGERFERVDLPGGWNAQPIFAMALDPRGGLWLGSIKDRLARWDGTTLTPAVLPGPMISRFRHLVVDASGRLWALSREALLSLGPDQVWRRDPLPGLRGKPRFLAMQVTARCELLLALDTDGAYLRRPDGSTRMISSQDGLPKEGVASILRDSRGDLWLGTDGAGLLAEAVPGLLSLDRDPGTGVGLGLGTVLTFAEEGPDRMYFGSTSGLQLWEKGRGLTRRWSQAQGLPSNEVWSIAPRQGGGVWLATPKGMAACDGTRILKGPKELENVFISGFLVNAGRLWGCTFEQGLVEMDLTGRFITRYPAPQEVGEPAILMAVPQGDGLLVGTRFGVYAFRNGVFRAVLRDTVGNGSIASLYRGPSGELWVGTGKDGVFGFPKGEGGPCVAYGEKNAGTHGRVGWIARLGNGDLAMGHGRGLSILPAAGGPAPVRRITRNLGLLSNETSDSAVLLDHQGRLWIGMVGGVCILDRAPVVPDPALPRPRIIGASAGPASYGLPQQLLLPPRPGTLTLRFDDAKPLAPENPVYQVWLEGAWHAVGEASNLYQIANLGPGAFQLRVRASSGLGWVESLPVRIQVKAAWYQTAWTRTGLVLGGILFVVLLVHTRLQRIRRRARMLEAKVLERTQELTVRNRSLERLHHQLKRSLEGRIQLMNTITHDLRSPLTGILLSVDRLESSPGLDRPTRSALKVVGHEAHRVESLLKHMLDSSRAESLTEGLHFRLCHPGEILEGLAETLQLKAESKDLDSSLALDPIGETTWVLADAEAMQQVLFNLIENALKFTPAPGAIGIRSRLLPRGWILEVWDTGRGIEPAQAADLFKPFSQAREADASTGWGLGLSICKALVEAHEGAIEVQSSPGAGSTFRVTLPLVTAD